MCLKQRISSTRCITILYEIIGNIANAGIVTVDNVKIPTFEDLEKTGFFVFHFDLFQDTRSFAICRRTGL